MNKHSKEKLIS